MKKTISLLLVLAMMLSLVPAIFAASDHAGLDNFQKVADYYDGRFTDVQSTDWFSTGIQVAYMLGLMNGSSDTKFSPNGEITIAETLTIACRIHSTYHGKDIDISNNSGPWYQPYIDYAIQNRMILSNEYSDYTKKASRANFANIIYASLPADTWAKINSVDKLPDVAASEWYGTPVFALYNAGVLTGSDSYGTFNPGSTIKRSEVATIITRVAIPSQRQTFTLEEPNYAPNDVKVELLRVRAIVATRLEMAHIAANLARYCFDNVDKYYDAIPLGIENAVKSANSYGELVADIRDLISKCGDYADTQELKRRLLPSLDYIPTISQSSVTSSVAIDYTLREESAYSTLSSIIYGTSDIIDAWGL